MRTTGSPHSHEPRHSLGHIGPFLAALVLAFILVALGAATGVVEIDTPNPTPTPTDGVG